MKKFNNKKLLSIIIIIISALLTVVRYRPSAWRLVSALKSLWVSIKYYGLEIFVPDKNNINVTVTALPDVDIQQFLPFDLEELQRKLSELFPALFDKYNFAEYLKHLIDTLNNLSMLILMLLPVAVLLRTIIIQKLMTENNLYNDDTIHLKAFKRVFYPPYYNIKQKIISYKNYLKEYQSYVKIFMFIWFINLNIATIITEFFAFYFYFAVSFKFFDIPLQLLKLLIDMIIMFSGAPALFWGITGYIIFDKIRRSIGYEILNHNEMKNRGFINSMPIVLFNYGTMGSRKTTLLVDMALSQQIMFRDKAFAMLLETDLRFPYFPWINLENEIKRAIEYKQIYNLATVRKFIRKKHLRFCNNAIPEKCFDYEFERYNFTYDDKLKVIELYQALEDYAQLYFIYIIQSSLIISNLAVRDDTQINDIGNLPLWDNELFKRDSKTIDAISRHSKILDFDVLRLGKQVIADNPKSGSFEFGVIGITEIGKERGNMLDLRETKKKTEEANQKNDLFNTWLKMCRHSATVCNYPFIKVYTDDQRPESLGADARELAYLLNVINSGDKKRAIPFFFVEDILFSIIMPKWNNFYTQLRYYRGDNTLIGYIAKSLTSLVNRYYEGVYNTFGYYKMEIETEKGTQDGQTELNEYYLSIKKTYSKRFSTDCFSDYFATSALKTKIGMMQYPEYETEKATLQELQQQNSYFINDLMKQQNKEQKEKE